MHCVDFDGWQVRSVRREHNVRADELVNEALDARPALAGGQGGAAAGVRLHPHDHPVAELAEPEDLALGQRAALRDGAGNRAPARSSPRSSKSSGRASRSAPVGGEAIPPKRHLSATVQVGAAADRTASAWTLGCSAPRNASVSCCWNQPKTRARERPVGRFERCRSPLLMRPYAVRALPARRSSLRK
jgi:hypothetical protein